MLGISTFKKGGVHPSDMKALSKDKATERMPVPPVLYVSMSQHLGAPATPVKAKGDRVEKGEVIGKASSFISADVHSPVSGTVKEIRNMRLAAGQVAPAVVIEADSEESVDFSTVHPWKDLSPEDLRDLVKEMGIVGMGGATFPTSVKFSVPPTKKVEYLVINAVECEPYITCDYRLMLERTRELVEGALIARKATGAEKVVIAIEANKMDAALLVEKTIGEMGADVLVQPLRMKYPQGDEKQLLKAVTGREIPSGKLPLDIGCIVCNAATTYAIYEAVVYHKPLFERIVTISGESVREPRNVIAPIGTPIGALIEYCGGVKEDTYEIVAGGPMMGFGIPDMDIPMVKGTGGILVLPDRIGGKTYPCVSCAKCIEHCPMGLLPQKMFKLIRKGDWQGAMELGLMDCKECGCCSYSCPSHIPLVQGFKLGKKMGRRK